jgi:methionine-rich copper-binding protein CopC
MAINFAKFSVTGKIFLSGLICVLALFAPLQFARAQPLAAPEFSYIQASEQLLSQMLTAPGNDEVLGSAPAEISIQFPRAVRLVKLTLRNESRDWVDIQFRYNPRPGQRYILPLPQLGSAKYYTADWAILGVNDQLIRGSFSFAFGPEARAPSFHKAAEELVMRQRYGDPSIQYVAPPRTQIIIDQEPRRFDPPFTINLDPQESPVSNPNNRN